MLRHLVTLIWNRKRANFLLITEIFCAFVVLFVVGSTLVYFRQNYQAPRGFDYQQVWQLVLDQGSTPQTGAQQSAIARHILQRLRTLPGVQYAAFTSANTPYSDNHSSTNLSRKLHGEGPSSNKYRIGPEMRHVLRLPLTAGRWFDPNAEAVQDEDNDREDVVISAETQAALFPDRSPLGQTLYSANRELRVIGVTGPFRADGDLSDPKPAVFLPVGSQDTTFRYQDRLLVRVQPSAGAALEQRMSAEIRTFGPGWTATITPLTEQRAAQLKIMLAPLVALVLVGIFLIGNVALGLFGVLWFNINQRRAEIGVRRAMGATAGAISGQIVGEILVVTTFGLGLGLVVAAQFPLLGVLGVPPGIYLTAMGLATGLIYALTAVCALYPSWLAAGIHPAVALRED